MTKKEPQEEQDTNGSSCLLTDNDSVWINGCESDTADFCDNDCEILR